MIEGPCLIFQAERNNWSTLNLKACDMRQQIPNHSTWHKHVRKSCCRLSGGLWRDPISRPSDFHSSPTASVAYHVVSFALGSHFFSENYFIIYAFRQHHSLKQFVENWWCVGLLLHSVAGYVTADRHIGRWHRLTLWLSRYRTVTVCSLTVGWATGCHSLTEIHDKSFICREGMQWARREVQLYISTH